MFYRFTPGNARVAVDLDGLYNGESLFLLGGSPTLNEMPLELLKQTGVVTLAVNNVPATFRPNIWLTADKPVCFEPRFYTDPGVLKFTMLTRRDMEVLPGLPMRKCPSMFFFGTTDKFKAHNFLTPHRDLVWWRSVFPMALQLAHRLGFRRVYLVGCGFRMDKSPGKQYAWNTKLTPDQAQYSQNTYSRDVKRLQVLMPVFAQHRFSIVSCTPGSSANRLLPYMELPRAVEEVLKGKPQETPTESLKHSSELRNQ